LPWWLSEPLPQKVLGELSVEALGMGLDDVAAFNEQISGHA
jgi:hypothetical protein